MDIEEVVSESESLHHPPQRSRSLSPAPRVSSQVSYTRLYNTAARFYFSFIHVYCIVSKQFGIE